MTIISGLPFPSWAPRATERSSNELALLPSGFCTAGSATPRCWDNAVFYHVYATDFASPNNTGAPFQVRVNVLAHTCVLACLLGWLDGWLDGWMVGWLVSWGTLKSEAMHVDERCKGFAAQRRATAPIMRTASIVALIKRRRVCMRWGSRGGVNGRVGYMTESGD